MKLFYTTNRYGKDSITVSAVDCWVVEQNPKTTKKITQLKSLFPNKVKTVAGNFYLKSYQ